MATPPPMYREPVNPVERTFRIHYRDDTYLDVTSEGWPWTYGDWVCIADMDRRVQYRPKSEVDHWEVLEG